MLTSHAHSLTTDGSIGEVDASAETLLILAAVNPLDWDHLTQNDLDQRIERAHLGSLVCRPTVPGPTPFGNFGNGKTTVVKAVLARLEVVDPALFLELEAIHRQSVIAEHIRERFVFARLEQAARQRQCMENRENLLAIAHEERPQDSVEALSPPRRM